MSDEILGEIAYQLESALTATEFLAVLRRSTLAERRPVEQTERIEKMIRNADVLVTARAGSLLVGVSRAITDFAYCTYLSDLAVDVDFQNQGIGKELIRRTHEAAGVESTLVLLAAPKAASYYPHIGLEPHGSCWLLKQDSKAP